MGLSGSWAKRKFGKCHWAPVASSISTVEKVGAARGTGLGSPVLVYLQGYLFSLLLVAFILLSGFINLPILGTSYQWNHMYLPFSDWLFFIYHKVFKVHHVGAWVSLISLVFPPPNLISLQ